VSSADRIVFPEPGWTRGDVVGYYTAVADAMFPHLVGRPLTLQ
jgi:bifunctional non-homologous end joining protein LigD